MTDKVEWDALSREDKIARLLRGWYELLSMEAAGEHGDGIGKDRDVIYGTPFGKRDGAGGPPHRYGLCIVGNSYEEAIFGELRELQESTAEVLGIRPRRPYEPKAIPVEKIGSGAKVDDEDFEHLITGTSYRWDGSVRSVTLVTNRVEETQKVETINFDGRWFISVKYPTTPGKCPACLKPTNVELVK